MAKTYCLSRKFTVLKNNPATISEFPSLDWSSYFSTIRSRVLVKTSCFAKYPILFFLSPDDHELSQITVYLNKFCLTFLPHKLVFLPIYTVCCLIFSHVSLSKYLTLLILPSVIWSYHTTLCLILLYQYNYVCSLGAAPCLGLWGHFIKFSSCLSITSCLVFLAKL